MDPNFGLVDLVVIYPKDLEKKEALLNFLLFGDDVNNTG